LPLTQTLSPNPKTVVGERVVGERRNMHAGRVCSFPLSPKFDVFGELGGEG